MNKLKKLLYFTPLERPMNMVLRYKPMVKWLNKINPQQNLSVLEVGSGSIGICRFYDGKVTGIDIAAEPVKHKRMKFIKGSALKLPFKDNSFDMVFSVDTLEHLSRKNQLVMIKEMYRVSKKHIALTYPIGFHLYHMKIVKRYPGSEVAKAYFEHLDGGTPDGTEIQRALKGKKYTLSVKKGFNPRWAYIFVVMEQNIFTKLIARTICKLFVPLFKYCYGSERKYWFVVK